MILLKWQNKLNLLIIKVSPEDTFFKSGYYVLFVGAASSKAMST